MCYALRKKGDVTMSHIIKNVNPFIGKHCETTATGTILKHIGIELSEPMLFGIGEGLSFIFWNSKSMDYPFIGGRIKPDALTQNIAKSLKLSLEVKETTSSKKAWENVRHYIDRDIPVGLKLDFYHLDYITDKIHFAGHYVVLYGYDDAQAYLVDSILHQATTSLHSLDLARKEKGQMSSNSLSYTIQRTGQDYDLKNVVANAIKNNALAYLNPPIKNIGYQGILKTSEELKRCFKNSKNIEQDFTTTAMLMEDGGTGGALFRNIYRDFLKESYELLGHEQLNQAYEMFAEIALLWNEVSGLINKAAITQQIEYINQASEILVDLSKREKRAMELLLTI
jgi:hypothetical protein